MWGQLWTASRRSGAFPTPTTVRLPFSGPLYSPPRLHLKFILHSMLLYRHWMEFKWSKPTRRWFSDHLLKWFRSQWMPSPSQHSNEDTSLTSQTVIKANLLWPFLAEWIVATSAMLYHWGHSWSLIPLPSGGFITFFWVKIGLTIIFNTLLVLCLHNLYWFSYALV